MVPGSVPRPVDGWLYYSDGRRLDRRIFAPPALALPRENGNLILTAAGRPRKPPATAPDEVIRPDPVTGAAVSYPPDDDPDEDADDGPP